MDVEVSTNAVMDTNGKRRRNKRWPEALKREIVAATFAPGASVSVVARQYDVNVNQVFGWRQRFGPSIATVPATSLSRPRLVEVTLTSPPAELEPTKPVLSPAAHVSNEWIEIEIAGVYRVRVGANFDGSVLRRLLDVLVRR
jgi:transposase